MAPSTRISFTGFVTTLAFLAIYVGSATAAINYCSSENTGESNGANYWTWQSNGWCGDKCRSDYAFAIVLGNDCWCSNYIPADQTDTGSCNDDCPGFPSEKCGNKADNLYGYIQLSIEPSGTQGGSQPTSASPSSASPSPVSSPIETQAPDPETVFRTVTESAPAVSSTPPSSEAPSTLKTTASSPAKSEGPEPSEKPATSIQVVTVSGSVVTRTIVNQPNTTSNPGLTQKQSKKTNVGAIVGGVLGGLALLGAIIALVLFFLWKKRKQQHQEDADGQSGVQRNVSTMSKAGLLRNEKPYPAYPPQIATTFNSSKRNSRMNLDTESISPISASDRRSSRPYVFDQRLNPSAIMVLDNGSRGSFASLDDSHDYGRALNVRNPDPAPRESIDARSQNPRT